jgi:hypothetical protein
VCVDKGVVDGGSAEIDSGDVASGCCLHKPPYYQWFGSR